MPGVRHRTPGWRPADVPSIIKTFSLGSPDLGSTWNGHRLWARAALASFALLAVVLPATGAHMAGFPRMRGASFSWSAFLIYALLILTVVAPFAWRIVALRSAPRADVDRRPFPWWGWLGVAYTFAAWALAWTRFPWFEPVQLYTFTPLWLGYIVVVNALTFRRTGRCLLRDRPGCLAALFFASALFWWYFEHVNRYVGNWHYSGVAGLDPFEYFAHATISFATVLPAVLSTRAWLASFPRLQAGLANLWVVPAADSKALALILLALGVLGLLGIGALPDYLYALVWVAPVLVLVSLQALAGQRQLLSGLARGDWRGVGLPALAALTCGFFWELWNWHSLAHWEYSIPFVHRFLIFEMPLLGYAGYLPFGLACAAVGDAVCERDD